MTAAELMRILVRRWYLTCLGAVVSMGVLVLSLQQPPVYFTQLDVVLLSPPDQSPINALRDGPHPLSPLAGLIVHDVNGGRPITEMASAVTTLYGEGVREGQRIRLRNHGSQWKPVFDVGIVDVQVVAADPEEVRSRATELVARLDEALLARQIDAGVAPPSRVTLESAPSDPVIQQVGVSRSRAAGSIAVLGAVLTFMFVAVADRWVARRRTRKSLLVQSTGPHKPDKPRELVIS